MLLVLNEVGTVGFDYHKACMKPVEVRKVGFDYSKLCVKVVEVRRFRFVSGYEACRSWEGPFCVSHSTNEACMSWERLSLSVHEAYSGSEIPFSLPQSV